MCVPGNVQCGLGGFPRMLQCGSNNLVHILGFVVFSVPPEGNKWATEIVFAGLRELRSGLGI